MLWVLGVQYINIPKPAVDQEYAESDSDSTSYHPVVEYIVYGKTYSVKGSVGYGRKKEEGSEVEVMFAFLVLNIR